MSRLDKEMKMDILRGLWDWCFWWEVEQPVKTDLEIDYTKRREEMRRMRYEEGKTLQEIGDRYGISRERARQIIGNTGKEFRRNWTKELIKSGKIKFNHWTELKNPPEGVGVVREWKRDWGNHRHVAISGRQKVGQQFEERASVILLENGIENILQPKGAYNILTANGARIDVTVSNTNIQGMISQVKCVYPTWAVSVRRKSEWDFLFAFIPDEEEVYTYYVIPRSAVWKIKGKDSRIRIPHPSMSAKLSKWHKYRKAIDLIKQHDNLLLSV